MKLSDLWRDQLIARRLRDTPEIEVEGELRHGANAIVTGRPERKYFRLDAEIAHVVVAQEI